MTYSENTVESNQVSQYSGRALTDLTVEHGLYALIALAAAIMRFAELDNIPLAPQEAREALDAWNLWQQGGIAQLSGSPFYHATTAFISQVAGFNDTAMRIIPALFGWVIVLLPWYLRHRLGRLGALIVSLLFAVSPMFALSSRTAGGQSVAIFAGVLFFIAWLRYQESSENRWLYSLAISLPIGLLADPIYYSLLFALAIGWLGQIFIGPALFLDDQGKRKSIVFPNRREAFNSILLAIAIFIIVGTALFFSPAGIGAGASLAVQWLGQFWSKLDSFTVVQPFAAIFRFEVALIFLGLPAIIWAARKERPFPLFLVYWTVAALLLVLLQREAISNIMVVAVPGYFLIGRFINDIVSQNSRWYYLYFAALVIVAGAIILVNLGRFSRLGTPQGADFAAYFGLLIIVSLVTLFLVVTIIWSWDQKLVPAGLALGILSLILIYSWGNAWWLSHNAANDTREQIINIGTDDDLPRVVSILSELSWVITNSANEIEITSTLDNPSLRWYLRDFDATYTGKSLSRDTNSQVIITDADSNPNLTSGYLGTDFAYLRFGSSGRFNDIYQTVRWWLFHENSIPIEQERAILWLRSDLAGLEGS